MAVKATSAGLLRIAVAVAGCVPVGAGLAGALMGPGFVGDPAASGGLDSHFRYLSGLLLGIGLAFWCLIPRLEQRTAPFRLLTAIVFAGGLSRALGVALAGPPPAPMVFGLVMELVVTPLLCLWQGRVAARAAAQASARAFGPAAAGP